MGVIDAFPAAVQERFDIVSFDPREPEAHRPSTAAPTSRPSSAADPATDPEGSAAAWASLADDCAERLGEHLGDYSTDATVDDIEHIREALGEERISWLGTSYGTRLGAEYLRQHPDRVRAMVLDGAMDPASPLSVQARDMAVASEEVLGRMLAACWGLDPCPLGDDPAAAYDALAASLRRQPLTTADGDTVGMAALQAAAQSASAIPFVFGQAFVDALVAAQCG